MSERVEITAGAGPSARALLRRFYDELYLPAFAHQREPFEAWEAALTEPRYRLAITLAGADLDDAARARLDGGVVRERYPASGCGLLTYLVVAPPARGGGLGRALLDHARRALAPCRAIFGEVSAADTDLARARLARFRRWGARVVDHPYVQPSLGPGLERDRALVLIAFFDGAPPPTLPGAVLADFLREFYTVTERAPLDRELQTLIDAIPPAVALR